MYIYVLPTRTGVLKMFSQIRPHKFRAPHSEKQFCGSSGHFPSLVCSDHRYCAIQSHEAMPRQNSNLNSHFHFSYLVFILVYAGHP